MSTALPLIFIFILTFAITAAFEKRLIPLLKRNAKQPIYADGPAWHMSKQGTPTMGGLGFLFSSSVAFAVSLLYLFSIGEKRFALSLSITFIYAVLNALIGIIDDSAKIKKRENAGLTPLQKLIFQTAAASVFLILRRFVLLEGSSVYFSFGELNLGVLYYPLCILMLLGTVNCANLTDGIDGLATGVSFALFTALSYFSMGANPDVAFLSFIMMGATLAFLLFNLHPARIFMGDTGSLFLGALAAAGCFSLGNPLLILPIGIVYVIEGVSVIIQVAVFKATKKRVFKMSPLHHHLEKCGWSENKIVIWAIILTLLCSLFASFIFA